MTEIQLKHIEAAVSLINGGTLLNAKAPPGSIPYEAARWHLKQAKVIDTRLICSADGCHRREPCGFACRDNGNFD
jgi:hypothetical protein